MQGRTGCSNVARLMSPFFLVAERVGFEPTVRETAHLISNQAHSTTLAPLHAIYIVQPGAWRRQHT